MILTCILLYVFTFTVIKDVHLEERNRKELNTPEKIIISILSVGLFFSMFPILAYYTIKSNKH